MLAATAKTEADIAYPCAVTPKIDGIRCLKVDGVPLSRSFKPIRNPYVKELLAPLPDGVDGELIVPGGTFQDTTSAIMSFDGPRTVEFLMFDIAMDAGYYNRISYLESLPSVPGVKVLTPTYCGDVSRLLYAEDLALREGWEGIVARAPYGSYKYGRSTLREGGMVKLKRMLDSEATILSIEEAYENLNPVVPDAFGYSRRPGGNILKAPKGTAGSIRVRDVHNHVEFSIGTGFDDALRYEMWTSQAKYIGKVVRYRYQPTGVKDKPRFPAFVGFRDRDDLSEHIPSSPDHSTD